MRIHFVYSDNFPAPSAYANRIHSLAKGLILQGDHVVVNIVFPGAKEKAANTIEKTGIYNSVPFKYYTKKLYKPDNRIIKKVVGIFGILSYIFSLFRNHRSAPDFIILCSSHFGHIFSLHLISKILHFKLLREKNEYPLFIIYNRKYLAAKKRYQYFDGFIFMTYHIKQFFENQLNIKSKSIVLPMTVDLERFKTYDQDNETKINYITLIGDVTGEKDGVYFLIHAFNLVHLEFPQIRLQLVGNLTNKDQLRNKLDLIQSLNLTDFIDFTGLVERDKIPGLLLNSKLLVLPRPLSKQAEGGFPTKLGEYMASGKPIIVTRTGEIQRYLEDGVHAFFVEPNDHVKFAEKIRAVLTNYEISLKVGLNARQLAYEIFSLEVQGLRLHNFMKDF
ncbi:MAG: glycosyltransferase family 4 protein [Bacteroidales bacterium]|nr:glycosyltransferase family 4 protein [Bacteroidales bacterium]